LTIIVTYSPKIAAVFDFFQDSLVLATSPRLISMCIDRLLKCDPCINALLVFPYACHQQETSPARASFQPLLPFTGMGHHSVSVPVLSAEKTACRIIV
jgi:hypothetical protein